MREKDLNLNITKLKKKMGLAKKERIEMLKSLIREHDEVIIAYLYGSAAQGNLRADSDIDIGILILTPF